MRGKPGYGHVGRAARGLIPAHAGKTRPEWHPRAGSRAHPRSCGENLAEQGWDVPALGSSPITRGKHCLSFLCLRSFGLIPDHAGKTACRTARLCCGRAHPHSRGEDVAVLIAFMVFLGSSPLTRGKRRGRRRSHLPARLIPAHAGKTLPVLRFYRADRSDLGKP